MNPSKKRFENQLKDLETIIKNAKGKDNPALLIFLNDFRTPIFKLEGLARIYSKVHNKKIFTKLKEQFKEIEDLLGAIDFYASFQREFINDPKLPIHIKQYFADKTIEKTKLFDKYLKKEDWYNGDQFKKISKELKSIKWQNEDKIVEQFQLIFIDEIRKIQEFTIDCKFEDLENDVHEYRRKLRWISIYANSLQGIIKLETTKVIAKMFIPYLTKEIIQSPYNKFELNTDSEHIIRFRKNNYLALSWLIAELGIIKDAGLKIYALTTAYQETELLSEEEAMIKTIKYLGIKYPKIETLLSQSKSLAGKFTKDKILNNLVFE